MCFFHCVPVDALSIALCTLLTFNNRIVGDCRLCVFAHLLVVSQPCAGLRSCGGFFIRIDLINFFAGCYDR